MTDRKQAAHITEHLIDFSDLPAGTCIPTNQGMKLAFGMLWQTWTDKRELGGKAVCIARELLRAQLTAEDCADGIGEARRLLIRKPSVKETLEMAIQGKGEGRP